MNLVNNICVVVITNTKNGVIYGLNIKFNNGEKELIGAYDTPEEAYEDLKNSMNNSNTFFL